LVLRLRLSVCDALWSFPELAIGPSPAHRLPAPVPLRMYSSAITSTTSSEPVPRTQVHRPHRTCSHDLAVSRSSKNRADARVLRMVEYVIGRNPQFEST